MNVATIIIGLLVLTYDYVYHFPGSFQYVHPLYTQKDCTLHIPLLSGYWYHTLNCIAIGVLMCNIIRRSSASECLLLHRANMALTLNAPPCRRTVPDSLPPTPAYYNFKFNNITSPPSLNPCITGFRPCRTKYEHNSSATPHPR